MNKLKKFLRLIIYLSICLLCYGIIKHQQNKITNERNAKVVSIISQWQTNGKPVKTMQIKKRDFLDFTKFTILSSMDNIYISYVTGTTAQKLKTGQNVYGTMDRRHLLGKITYVADSIDFDKGLFMVKIEVQKAPDKEHRNLVVFVHTSTDEDVLWVPIDAVEFEKTANDVNFFVWVIKDNKAYKQPIKESKISETGIQIKEGLTQGTEIVIFGKTALKENDDVCIIGDEK